MNNNLKYLKDYETSTDYEKFIELLDKGFTIITEFTDTWENKTQHQLLRWANCYETGYNLLAGGYSLIFFKKSDIIEECKKHNLHYIIPKEQNE